MSKLAIVLCAVLFTSAVNGCFSLDALESAQHEVHRVLNAAILKVQKKFEATRKAAQEVKKNLSDVTDEFNDKFVDETVLVMRKLNDLASKPEDVDISKCIELSRHLVNIAIDVCSNTEVCTTNIRESRFEYIRGIDNVFDNARAKLTEIEKEAQQCSDNIHDLESTLAAISCIKAAGSKATRVSDKFVRMMTLRDNRLNFFSKTLQPALDSCRNTNGFANFLHESLTVVERTEKCIQRKIDEADTTSSKFIAAAVREFTVGNKFSSKRVPATVIVDRPIPRVLTAPY